MNFLYYVSIAKYLVYFTILYYVLGLITITKIQSSCFIHKHDYRIFNGIFPIVTIFVLFSFCDGDNFHYIKWFYLANRGGDIDDTLPQEPIYQLLSYFFNGEYLLFRIFVWGSAILIFCLTSRRLKIPPRVSLISLYCLFLFIFSYARASLGMCLYFYGFSFIIKPTKANVVYGYIIGLLLIGISFIFHTSMATLIAFTIPMLLITTVKDNTLGICKILIYILIITISVITLVFIIQDYIDSLDIPILSRKLSRYTQMDEDSKGLFNFIIETSISTLMILCLFFTRYRIYKLKCNNKILNILFFYGLTLFLIGFVLSFLGSGYAIISYRIKYMSIIPITLLVAYTSSFNIIKYKKFLLLEIFGVSITIFRMIFYYYLSIKGLGIDLNQSY